MGKFRDMTIKAPALGKEPTSPKSLYDIDTKILGLEAKLAKARQVKQGMMLELLTGRI